MGEAVILRQRTLIRRLTHLGRDTTVAHALLAQFQDTQRATNQELHQMREELGVIPHAHAESDLAWAASRLFPELASQPAHRDDGLEP